MCDDTADFKQDDGQRSGNWCNLTFSPNYSFKRGLMRECSSIPKTPYQEFMRSLCLLYQEASFNSFQILELYIIMVKKNIRGDQSGKNISRYFKEITMYCSWHPLVAPHLKYNDIYSDDFSHDFNGTLPPSYLYFSTTSLPVMVQSIIRSIKDWMVPLTLFCLGLGAYGQWWHFIMYHVKYHYLC